MSEMLTSRIHNYLKYLIVSKCRYPLASAKRYKILLDMIYKLKCRTIMEIGVYDGRRAREMIETACIHWPAEDITYLGFDLFEEMDETILRNEFSKMPTRMKKIKQVLDSTGANVHLFKGWSQDTLQEFSSRKKDFPSPDFVFIEGGHSVETISSDWKYISEMMSSKTTIIFDDYYTDCPHLIEKYGCNQIIDKLDRHVFSVEVSGIEDSFQKDWGRLNVHMVKVSRRK